MRDRRHDDGEHHRREQIAQDEAPPRQVKGEERDVHAELLVVHPEVRAVAPLQVGLPGTGGRGAAEQADDDRATDHDSAAVGLDRGAVAVELGLAGRHRHVGRANPVGHDEVGRHDERHEGAEDDEQPDLGEQLGREHGGEAHRLEPQQVGVEAGEGPEQGHQNADDDDRREQCPTPAPCLGGGRRRARSLGLVRDVKTHSDTLRSVRGGTHTDCC